MLLTIRPSVDGKKVRRIHQLQNLYHVSLNGIHEGTKYNVVMECLSSEHEVRLS